MAAIGHEIVRLDEVVSTNSLVMGRRDYLERHGLVVLARHQTGGRGRMGRHWASVPGHQLQFSVVVHPAFPATDFPVVTLLSGLAVAQAIEQQLRLSPRLKWPNDVMLSGRKVCGILVEGVSAGSRPRLVVGIGINCLGGSEDFPAELRDRLTTLALEAGRPVDMEALLQAVLARIEALCGRMAEGGKAEVLALWREHALLGAGERLRIPTQEGEREGVPEGITPEGYLIVRLPDGSRRVHVSGELEWLR